MNELTRETAKLRGLVAAVAVVLAGGACGGAASRAGDENPKEPPPATTSLPVTVTIQPAPAWRSERMDAAQAATALKNRGSLPSLAANEADCLGPDPVGFGGAKPVSNLYDLALTEDLTADLLVESCLDGYYYDQTGPRAAAELCVQEGTFPRPVVAIGWSCAEAGKEAGRQLRPPTDDDLAQLNAMRAVEVALMADPATCPSEQDTVAWTERILREAELALQVHVHNEPHMEHGSDHLSEPIDCPLLTRVAWDEAAVYVEPFHS